MTVRTILRFFILPRALLVAGGLMLPCIALAPIMAHAQSETQAEIGDASSAAEELPEPSAFEWSLLDPEIPVTVEKRAKVHAPTTLLGSSASWNRTAGADGASAVTVKQSVTPFWDTKIGADFNLAARDPTTSSEALARKIAGEDHSQSSGSAWANLTAPGLGRLWDKTTIEARVDPADEQTRLGTSISKSLPLGGPQTLLTLQNGYSVTEQGALPLAGSNRTIEVDRSAKLSFKTTGTSVIAGETSAEETWLRRVGVEQKMFGAVSVSASVSQTLEGAADKRLSAAFKQSW